MSKTVSLQSSIEVLFSLYLSIEQNFDALTYYSRFIEDKNLKSSETKEKLPERDFTIDAAIIESLWFQIILHSCSFLEEWDKVLGIQNEKRYADEILEVKKIVSPAGRAVKKWKDLKRFRNEVIAHSFRNKKGDISLYTMSHYNCPQNEQELYYLVCLLNRMTMVLADRFSKKMDVFFENYTSLVQEAYQINSVTNPTTTELNEALNKVDKNINIQSFPVTKENFIQSLVNKLDSNG